jgi:hypothetical protein
MHVHRQNTLKRNRPARRGYALMLVMCFVVLFVALLGTVARGIASALRIAAVRAVQSQRDAGSIPALARALHLLETGPPPDSPYVCGMTIDTPRGPRNYTITFSADGETGWSVHVAATGTGQSVLPMPDTFAVPP